MIQLHSSRTDLIKDEPFIYIFQDTIKPLKWYQRLWRWFTFDPYTTLHDSGYLFPADTPYLWR